MNRYSLVYKKRSLKIFILQRSQRVRGAVAQMGERMTGSHEVRGSIPLSSTSKINLGLAKAGPFFYLFGQEYP